MTLRSEAQKKHALPLYLGKDAGGEAIVVDMSRMPHWNQRRRDFREPQMKSYYRKAG
jgi:hypothetical protein